MSHKKKNNNYNNLLAEPVSQEKINKVKEIIDSLYMIKNELKELPSYSELIFISNSIQEIVFILEQSNTQQALKEVSINAMLKHISNIELLLKRQHNRDEASTAKNLLYFFTSFIDSIPLDALNEVDERILRQIRQDAGKYGVNAPKKQEEDIETLKKNFAVEESKRLELEQKLKDMETEHKKSQEEANSLLMKAGAAKIITHYDVSAKSENLLAHIFFGIGMFLLLAGSGVVVWFLTPYIKDTDKAIEISRFVFKATVYLVFLVPAIYFLQESKKHKEEAFRLRDIVLKTAAIPQYLKNISDKTAQNISAREGAQLKLAEQIFTQHYASKDCGDDITKKTLEIIEELIKTKTGK